MQVISNNRGRKKSIFFENNVKASEDSALNLSDNIKSFPLKKEIHFFQEFSSSLESLNLNFYKDYIEECRQKSKSSLQSTNLFVFIASNYEIDPAILKKIHGANIFIKSNPLDEFLIVRVGNQSNIFLLFK